MMNINTKSSLMTVSVNAGNRLMNISVSAGERRHKEEEMEATSGSVNVVQISATRGRPNSH